MKNLVLIIFLLSAAEACVMAQDRPSEIPVEGGELVSIELPKGGVAYRKHDQKFLYILYIEKDGTVGKVTFQYGKEFDQKNADLITKSLKNWRFNPFVNKENGEIIECGLYITISLGASPGDDRVWMTVLEGSSLTRVDGPFKILEALIPLAQAQDLTEENRKNLTPENHGYSYPKIEGLLPKPE